jgi:hypothetical protein
MRRDAAACQSPSGISRLGLGFLTFSCICSAAAIGAAQTLDLAVWEHYNLTGSGVIELAPETTQCDANTPLFNTAGIASSTNFIDGISIIGATWVGCSCSWR